MVGLVFRMVIVTSLKKATHFLTDGTGYHRMAVNLTMGNGLSNGAALYSVSFREPGYPVFLSVGSKIYTLFGGTAAYIDLDTY